MAYSSIFRDGLFDGAVGIVTGGGSGIGRCIAHELSRLGARVVVASRKEEKLQRVQAEIQEAGGRCDVIACDIRDEEQVKALVRRSAELGGHVDFVVNNGGGQFVSPIENISLNGWRAVVETNLTGTFLVSREAYLQCFESAGRGAIVNIVADMWRGMPMMGHSGAARAGVVNMTQTMAIEWAKSAVRVNAVAPGIILSSGFQQYPEAVRDYVRGIRQEVPAARFGTESEVSAAVAFLLSPAAAYITGATLRVDGALSLYRQPFPLGEREPFPSFDGLGQGADLPEGFE